MSSSNPNSGNYSSTNSSVATPVLKLYQAFIFSIPICFTFILLVLFYFFYLRRRSVDWSSLRMRAAVPNAHTLHISASAAELGLKREVREMLPIIIYNESFSVKDPQCSVCLGDYQADDKLQRIPTCGHSFHMECIDLWLTMHTTCPLCRLSLISKPSTSESHDSQDTENGNQTSVESGTRFVEEGRAQRGSESMNEEETRELEQESHQIVNQGSEAIDSKMKIEKDERNVGTSDACLS